MAESRRLFKRTASITLSIVYVCANEISLTSRYPTKLVLSSAQDFLCPKVLTGEEFDELDLHVTSDAGGQEKRFMSTYSFEQLSNHVHTLVPRSCETFLYRLRPSRRVVVDRPPNGEDSEARKRRPPKQSEKCSLIKAVVARRGHTGKEICSRGSQKRELREGNQFEALRSGQ